MLPQQVNPSHREDIATAPYNFVPLPDRPLLLVADHLPDQDVHDPARYTGSIACSLTTETPTFVRAPLTAEAYRDYKPQDEKKLPYEERTKNKPAFFHTGDPQQPLIPASTLRGLMRSLVEIIGYGRFESVTQRRLIYRAVGDTSSHGDRYRNQILISDGQGSEGTQKYYAYTPRVRAGYLVQLGGEWRLYTAQQISGTSFARISHRLLRPLEGRLAPIAGCKNAYTIYFEPGRWEHQRVRGGFIRLRYAAAQRAAPRQEPGLTPGALVYSGRMFSKRSEAVVYPLDPNKFYRINDEMIAVYRDQISAEQANLLGEEGVLSAGMSKDQTLNEQDGLPAQRQPVFYLVERVKNPKTNEPEERVSFFGHTMMMRLPYPYAVRDFVPPALQADPERKTVDLAQAIFGFVPLAEAEQGQSTPKEERRKTANGYAGRVFFGDARLDGPQERLWLLDPGDPQGWLTPKILGTPKPTAFQLYLVQRTPDPLPRQGSSKVQKALADYASTPPGVAVSGTALSAAATQGETALRGYKRYWHKRSPVTRATIEEPAERINQPRQGDPSRRQREEQYTCMAPLAPGVRLTFSIRFENLAAWELGALLWALQPPVPEGAEVRHQVGMGKPLGMGSVRLQVEKLRLEDRRARYSRLFVEPEAGRPAVAGEAAWETGARTPQPGETPSDLMAAFERYLLDQLGERRAQRLSDLPRIQALLALMAWPGPPDVETRYQGLEEFRSRPVLPAPAPVAATPGRAPTPATTVFSTERASSTSSTPAQPAIDAGETLRWMQERAAQTVLPPSDARRGPAARLTSRHEAKEGMKVLGTAVRVTVDLRVEIDLGLAEIKGFLPDRQIVPPVRDRADLEARFPAGTPVEAWISRIDKRGVVLTMREPSL